MKFCWTTITVGNLEESLKFYQEIIGLSLINRYKAGPGAEIAFLGEGETKVELICYGSEKQIQTAPDISLGFEVDSVDKKLDILKQKGIVILSGPIQPNPHVKFFFIADPNGWRIQFVENM